MPCSFKDFIEQRDAKRAYPSSAPPRPNSLSSFITGVQGPRPLSHPSISGCLSRCPYINMFPSFLPGTSTKMMGVLPTVSFVVSLAPSGRFSSAQFFAISKTLSMYPFFFQSGSKEGDLFGILMYSIRVGRIESSQNLSTKDCNDFLSRLINCLRFYK